jgi:hypothetical protein
MSSPSAKNISLRGLLDTALLIPAVPPRLKRGVSRSSRTWVRDAVAACGAKTNAHSQRTAKSCGPDAPTLASSRPRCLRITACDGDNKPGSPGRARRKPLKPLRREGRNDPVNLWCTYSYVFYFYIRGCGRIRRPAFPAPSVMGGTRLLHHLGVFAPRERRRVPITPILIPPQHGDGVPVPPQFPGFMRENNQ